MNRVRCLFVVCLIALLPSVGMAAEDAAPPEKEQNHVPGVTLAQGITEITGVAISPMLGVSAVGAWTYWNTPGEFRARLPWYAQPWAWGTGLAILFLCFLKDSFGTAVPGILKKPLDMVELFENKASAAIASGAFVPLVAHEMARHLETRHEIGVPTASLGSPGLAMIDPSWFLVPASIVAFLVVWVCSHAINVLIILSPSSFLDALLKLGRTGLLAAVGIIYLIAPWLAAVFCLLLIAAAAWMAPSALRFMIFGARFAGDILLPGRGRRRMAIDRPHAFTLGRMAGLPARTGGRLLLADDGTPAFRYRRWCVLDERTIPLPAGTRHVEKGLFSPSLVHQAGAADEAKLLLFLPRYRGQETGIVERMKFDGTRDHAVLRGFAALKTWVGTMLRRGRERLAG
ncbi:MAG: hypothetical protein KDN05_10290 [Verrucomicrobiae bacterium]|nr:hypothetical protein [Verrucomicrobiae bacterium]